MLIYCVRHAESTYNAAGRIQGQSDIPLSPFGHRQAAALAAAFEQLPVDAVYCSPLVRALETARPIAESKGLEIVTDPRLTEIDAGMFQDKLWSEISRTHPEAARRWIAQEPDFVIPGGESRRDLMIRGKAALESIRDSGKEHCVVVSHGGLLTGALKALLEIPAERHPISLWNASISRIAFGARFKLLTLNEVHHLGALETRSAGDGEQLLV